MKTKATKKPHPWAELAKATPFSIAQLRVLYDHHATLHRFCVDPETARPEEALADEESDVTGDAAGGASGSTSESSLDMTFEQYVMSICSLVTYGSSTQQFEYLFQTYAIENERGISRSELFELLKDHYKAATATQASGTNAAETRHFERLYTWLKKHFNVYDKTRCGFLSLPTALEMLHIHPDALYHLQLQLDPFIKKLGQNNQHYATKAHAAAIEM